MTVEELLKQRVIPIFNENDTVSVDELKFGDNDLLSALVANLVKAQHLVIVTDTNGLYTADPRKDPAAKRYDRIPEITAEIYAYAGARDHLWVQAGCAPRSMRPKWLHAEAYPYLSEV